MAARRCCTSCRTERARLSSSNAGGTPSRTSSAPEARTRSAACSMMAGSSACSCSRHASSPAVRPSAASPRARSHSCSKVSSSAAATISVGPSRCDPSSPREPNDEADSSGAIATGTPVLRSARSRSCGAADSEVAPWPVRVGSSSSSQRSGPELILSSKTATAGTSLAAATALLLTSVERGAAAGGVVWGGVDADTRAV